MQLSELLQSTARLIPQPVVYPDFSVAGINVHMLRLDQIHPVVSGNKLFKLKKNLKLASEQKAKTLVSFGGAWSNHLHALAFAGSELGIDTVGFVRGEMPEPLNPCLEDCRQWGMTLLPLSRQEYRCRHDRDFISSLVSSMSAPFVIPEGGANLPGIRGCAQILEGIDQNGFDQIALACGTGTTLAGLLSESCLPVLGIQVLKGEGYLTGEVTALIRTAGVRPGCSWQILAQFHRGGYARTDHQLLDFCLAFESETGIPLEPVYSGKLMMALCELAREGAFTRGHRLLVVHGGGLQGRRGFSI